MGKKGKGKRKASGGAKKKGKRHNAIASLLVSVGLTSMDRLESCANLEDEWSVVKSCYRKECLRSHPDKGGTEEGFRDLQTAFETLRTMYEKRRIDSFRVEPEAFEVQEEYDFQYEDVRTYTTPSYDFYEAAAEVDVPQYKVELAKSNRSSCNMSASKSCPQCPTSCNAGSTWKSVWKGKTKAFPSGRYEDVRYNHIPKGAIRIGRLDEQSGTYTNWVHVDCWRVPYKIWVRMPAEDQPQDPVVFEKCLISLNEVLFTGMQELSKEDRAKLVRHVMNRKHWAAHRGPSLKGKKAATPTKKENPKIQGSDHKGRDTSLQALQAGLQKAFNVASSLAVSGVTDGSKPSTSIVKNETPTPAQTTSAGTALKPKKPVFLIPRPGPENKGCMAGKTCVLTGVFPEVGGGTGLNLGKDKVKKIVESFGGVVRSAVSGVTDILIVGHEPGMSKVSKARGREKCALLQLGTLCDGIRNNAIEATVEHAKSNPLQIGADQFSQGYMIGGIGNSLAYRSTQEQLDYASGKSPKKYLGPGTSKTEAGEEEKDETGKKKKKKKEKAKILPDFFREGMEILEKDIPVITQLFTKGGPLNQGQLCDKLYLSVAKAKELNYETRTGINYQGYEYTTNVFHMPGAFKESLEKFGGVEGLNKRKIARENRRGASTGTPSPTPKKSKKRERDEVSKTESKVKRKVNFDVGVEDPAQGGKKEQENDKEKQYKSLKVAQLKTLLEEQGLSTNGKKADLIARLLLDFSGLKVAEIKARLKAKGLPTNGKKAELVARLKASC